MEAVSSPKRLFTICGIAVQTVVIMEGSSPIRLQSSFLPHSIIRGMSEITAETTLEMMTGMAAHTFSMMVGRAETRELINEIPASITRGIEEIKKSQIDWITVGKAARMTGIELKIPEVKPSTSWSAASRIKSRGELGDEIARHLGSPKAMERMMAYLRYVKPKKVELVVDEMLAIKSEIDAWREKKEAREANAAYNELLYFGFADED